MTRRSRGRRRARNRFAIVAGMVLALAVSVAPAHASEEDPPDPNPLVPITQDDLPTPGAVSYRFRTGPGADFSVGYGAAYRDSTLVGGGVWLYDAAGQLVMSRREVVIDGALLEVKVEVPDPTIGVIVNQQIPGSELQFPRSGMGITIEDIEPGEYVAVMGNAGNGTRWEAHTSLWGRDGVTLLSKSFSATGFAYRERDFRDGLTILVSADTSHLPEVGSFFPPATVNLKQISEAKTGFSPTRRLFGEFGQRDGTATLRINGPPPYVDRGPGPWLFNGAPDGNYEFIIETCCEANNAVYAWGFDIAPAPAA